MRSSGITWHELAREIDRISPHGARERRRPGAPGPL